MLENYKSSLLDIISILFISDKIYFLTHLKTLFQGCLDFLNCSFNLLKRNRFRSFDIVLLEILNIVYLSITKIFKKLFIFIFLIQLIIKL